jgi:hypothetical protein
MIAPRRKRIWSIADFAMHAYGEADEPACRRAKRFLLKLNAKHGGQLLIKSECASRGYSIIIAKLRKLEAELFEPVEPLEFKVEELAELLEQMKSNERAMVKEISRHSLEIIRLKARRHAEHAHDAHRERRAS